MRWRARAFPLPAFVQYGRHRRGKTLALLSVRPRRASVVPKHDRPQGSRAHLAASRPGPFTAVLRFTGGKRLDPCHSVRTGCRAAVRFS